MRRKRQQLLLMLLERSESRVDRLGTAAAVVIGPETAAVGVRGRLQGRRRRRRKHWWIDSIRPIACYASARLYS